MVRNLASVLAIAFLFASHGTSTAHHSFAMFDQDNPIELTGVVKDFRYSAPHVFIFLEVHTKDGTVETWSLEGNSPSALRRDGWSAKTLKPGDELIIVIDPLRSGAPGGAFITRRTKFKDGRPVVITPPGGRQ